MTPDGKPTTLEEIEALPKKILHPADVAVYLGVNQYSINCASKAGQLPWAYQMGSTTMIPKESFINFHRYGRTSIITSGLISSAEAHP